MDVLETLLGRRSATALREPGPDEAALSAALQAAVAAPDHGRMQPWRFLLISGDDRHRFGALLVQSLLRQEPDAGERAQQRERQRALRAPLIIVAAACVNTRNPKVPEVEQLMAVGAAVENLLLALCAHGFGTMWKTGPAAYCPLVRQGLGLQEDDRIIGFVYAGTPDGPAPEARRGDYREVVRRWPD